MQRNGFASVNGAKLYYEIDGTGVPVVLIPGYTLDTRMWEPQIPVLAPTYLVVRYDLRGAGKSAPPSGEEYAYHADLQALMDYLEIDNAHIVGLSLGGAIAIDFALTYPDRTLSLTVADVSGLGGYEWPAELNTWFAPIFEAGQRGDVEAAKQHWLNTGWFDPIKENPTALAQLEAIMTDYSGWHFQQSNPATELNPPAFERLTEIQVPTLVIVGEFDVPFYNLLIADVLANRIPGARKVVIKGAGHMSNMEDADQFNDALLAFLASLSET